MSGAPAVSIVVPTHQRRAALVRLLEALARQTLPASEFEVVVVVDGSDDGTDEAVDSLAAPYRLRRLWCDSRGRAAAVNAGVAAADGEIIVILDDDMTPEPELLTAHLHEHADGMHVGVVGAAPVHLDPQLPSFTRFTGRRFNDVLAEMATRSRRLAFSETYTGNFSVRRDDFRAAGGFDETFDGYGLEDYELALRLTRAGVTLVLSTVAVAYQSYDKSFAAAARDNESRGRSAFIFAALHPDHVAAVALHDRLPPSRVRRLFRYVAPRMTLLVPATRALALRSVEIAERRRMTRLPFAYELGLEYFYLVGLAEANRDRRLTARGSKW